MAMSGGIDTNLLLYSPYSGVWAYDHENEIMENRVLMFDLGFAPNMDFWPLTFLPDGRLLFMGQNINENNADDANAGNSKYLLLKYIPVVK